MNKNDVLEALIEGYTDAVEGRCFLSSGDFFKDMQLLQGIESKT